MSNPTPTMEVARQHKAGELAESILRASGITSYPIDPLDFIRSNCPGLRAGGADFKNRFDGQLEYHASRQLFLLMYNNKYDAGSLAGRHHPRTRFSICHELGHYFLDHHRIQLLTRHTSHKSTSEFRSNILMEREADAFAASFLMPSYLVGRVVNQSPLTLYRLEDIASNFETSLVSTCIRCVQISDFPCGAIGIRNGVVAWSFVSQALVNSKIYPRPRGSHLHTLAGEAWQDFLVGGGRKSPREVPANHWFQIYDDAFRDVWAKEEYIPAPVLGTLIVLVTINEDDLSSGISDDYDEDCDE